MNMRRERIERLLAELEYEVTRGILEGDLDERMSYHHTIPVSKEIEDGVVQVRYVIWPTPREMSNLPPTGHPRLRVVVDNG